MSMWPTVNKLLTIDWLDDSDTSFAPEALIIVERKPLFWRADTYEYIGASTLWMNRLNGKYADPALSLWLGEIWQAALWTRKEKPPVP